MEKIRKIGCLQGKPIFDNASEIALPEDTLVAYTTLSGETIVSKQNEIQIETCPTLMQFNCLGQQCEFNCDLQLVNNNEQRAIIVEANIENKFNEFFQTLFDMVYVGSYLGITGRVETSNDDLYQNDWNNIIGIITKMSDKVIRLNFLTDFYINEDTNGWGNVRYELLSGPGYENKMILNLQVTEDMLATLNE